MKSTYQTKVTYEMEEYHNSRAILINRVTRIDHLKNSQCIATIQYHIIGISKARSLAAVLLDELRLLDELDARSVEAKKIAANLINNLKSVKC